MNKTQVSVFLIQTRLNFTTDFLSQNNLKAKYQGKNGYISGARHLERATLILSQCHGIFTNRSGLGFFSREICQLWSTRARLGKEKNGCLMSF